MFKRVASLITTCLVAGSIVGAFTTSARAASPAKVSGASLEVLGVVPETTGNSLRSDVVAMDEKRRRMYTLGFHGSLFYLNEYDLEPDVPKLLRQEMVGTSADLGGLDHYSPYTISLDSKRGLLIVMVPATPQGSNLKLIDLKTLKYIGDWDVSKLLPGFIAQGITYVPRDGNLYMVGTVAGHAQFAASPGAQKPAMATFVVALKVTSRSQQPEVRWIKPIPQCQQAMDTFAVGALIARSENLPALYFACVRPNPFPGESGVVRLWIDPKGDAASSAESTIDFFPVSGSYSLQTLGIIGVSAFDYERERFYVQSLSPTTPGAWVLDGHLSAWVGFIAAPDMNNKYVGLDQRAGHYFMGGGEKPGYMTVSDVSGLPISQGEIVEGIKVQGFMVADPSTNRLFVPADIKGLGLGKSDDYVLRGLVAIRDRSQIAPPAKPLDYDSITRDVKEGPGVETSFSGGANGYGSRLLMVGGYGGLLSATGQRIGIPGLRPGDRGLTMARVSSVDLRRAGASASAQASLPDANTISDLNDGSQGEAEWPWAPASCLAGGSDSASQEEAGNGGQAKVDCDLENNESKAFASWGPLVAEQVSIGSSTFSARAWRDPNKGVLTESVAAVRGVEVNVPGGGSLSIARIWARATTVAKGRTGSAASSYERRISGIELTDAKGNVEQRFAGCGMKEDASCRDVVKELNKALTLKLRIKVPQPVVVGTPGGAFAGVQQSEGEFHEGQMMDNQGSTFASEAASRAMPALQVTLYNDTEEKSRLVGQFAAIQSNSIYTNTPISDQPPTTPILPEVDPPPAASNAGSGLGSIGSGSADIAAPDLSGDVSAEAPVLAVPTNVVEGTLAFLTRSPGEALLMGSIWLMFGGAGLAAFRRRSLLSLLQES